MSPKHLHVVRNNGNERCVVFVHGVLSNSEKGWTSKSGKYWPKLLAEEQDEEILAFDIFAFTYPSNIWSRDYRIDDAARLLKANITDRKLTSYKTIVFVCHSMGGIVTRRCIVESENELEGFNIALFLVASPSMGSSYANYIAPLGGVFKHSQAKALKRIESNEWLQSLDSDFLNLRDRGKVNIIGKELVEDKLFSSRSWVGFRQVVTYYSANRYFGEALKIPNSDHVTISKPEGKDSQQHRALCNFIFRLDTDYFCRRESESAEQLLRLQEKIASIEALSSKVLGLLDCDFGHTLSDLEKALFPFVGAPKDAKERLIETIGQLTESNRVGTVKRNHSFEEVRYVKLPAAPASSFEMSNEVDSVEWFVKINEKLKSCSYARIYLHSFDHPDDFRPKHQDQLKSILSLLSHKISVGADIKIIAYNSQGKRTGVDWLRNKIDSQKLERAIIVKNTQETHNTSSMYLFGDDSVVYNSKGTGKTSYYVQEFPGSIIHYTMKVGLEKLFEARQ